MLTAGGNEVSAGILLAGATAVVVAAYLAASRIDVDGTTEVAALVVLAAGTVAGLGQLAVAGGLIAVTGLLLAEKTRLHALAARVDDDDLRSGLRFAAMALVILPVLPEGHGCRAGRRPPVVTERRDGTCVALSRDRRRDMLTLTRILCPTDFSEVSTKAERFALALVRHYGGRLSLLHVDPPTPLLAAYGEIPVDLHLFEEQRWQADRDMQAARERAAAGGVTVDAEVRGGSAAREILEVARTGGVDLIVLGTHGRGDVEHLLLGSVAERVLRKAPCPVMIVPATADADRGVLFTRILCPIDGSAPSAAAVAFAVSLARETNGAITLQQVVAPWPVAIEIAAMDAGNYQRQAEAQARTTLRDAVPAEVREWCRIDEEISVGRASEQILAAAAAHAADVIVMGVRGRNAIDLLAFGSTTNDVVRRAQCPVLVVHTPTVVGSRPGLAATVAQP